MAAVDLTEAAHEVEGVVVVMANQTSRPDLETGPAPTRHAEITTFLGGRTATSATQNDPTAPGTVVALVGVEVVEVVDSGVEGGVGVIEGAVVLEETVEGVETDSEEEETDLEEIAGAIEVGIVVEVGVALEGVVPCVEVVGVGTVAEVAVIVIDPIKFLFLLEETTFSNFCFVL